MDRQWQSTFFGDLFDYNRWATQKVLALSSRLDDAALDREEPMGPGSLRATLFHIWGAEHLWLERWKGTSPPKFPAEKNISIAELQRRFETTHLERTEFLATAGDLDRPITYRNLAGNEYTNKLDNLLLHVANHGIHHRAQCLHYLRLAGVTIKGGIDYLFYRIAFPSVPLPEDIAAIIKRFGMEVAVGTGVQTVFDPRLLARYREYGNWAMDRLFGLCDGFSDDELDRDFSIGMGSLRKTLTHIYDAEFWWNGNWQGELRAFEKLPQGISLPSLRNKWNELAESQAKLLEGIDSAGFDRIVEATMGFGTMRFRMGESAMQLCGHGTHHRAQAINMLRRLGRNAPAFDLVEWVRESAM